MNSTLARAVLPAGPEVAHVKELSVDMSVRRASLAGRELDLAVGEFDVLAMLADRAGELVTSADAGTALTTHVKRLRHKLDDSQRAPRYIETVTGPGYRLVGMATYPLAEEIKRPSLEAIVARLERATVANIERIVEEAAVVLPRYRLGSTAQMRRLTSSAAGELTAATVSLRVALRVSSKAARRAKPAAATPSDVGPLTIFRTALQQALSALDPQVLLALEHYADTAGGGDFGGLVRAAWRATRHAWVTLTLALAALPSGAESIRAGNLTIDRATRRASGSGTDLGLAGRHFELLDLLADRVGAFVGTRCLSLRLWRCEHAGRSLTDAIHELRQNLDDAHTRFSDIQTVGDAGYRFDPPNTDRNTTERTAAARLEAAHGDLVIDTEAYRARHGGVELKLTVPEFRLLAVLHAHAGWALTYWQLGQLVWRREAPGTLIRVTMRSLRGKLGDEIRRSHDIVTIPAVGLRFEERTDNST
jgi:DNA-binding response OmpR family regulator